MKEPLLLHHKIIINALIYEEEKLYQSPMSN
jgi:hypothetical protein